MGEAVDDHETDIGAQFRSVLAKERDCLADVTGPGDLMLWRLRLVREFMDCRSPYALSVRHGQAADNQGEFLRRHAGRRDRRQRCEQVAVLPPLR